MSSYRAMLVDDHAVFRETLAVGLASTGDIEVVAQAGSAAECVRRLHDLELDVLVLDLSMPGRGGADLIGRVQASFPNVAVLILSAHPPDHFVVRLLRQGARGYLHKSCSLQQVIDGVKGVAEGHAVLDPNMPDLDTRKRIVGGSPKPHELLSNREYQVMERLVAGVGVSEIAAEMSLSVKTISTYRKRLLDKLGMKSNSELVGYAIRSGIGDI